MSRGCDTSSTSSTSGSARESTNRVRDAAESAACSASETPGQPANRISRTGTNASNRIGHTSSKSANRVCGACGRVTTASETSSEATNGISHSSKGVSRHQLTLLHLITLREATGQRPSSTCRCARGVASSAWYCSCGSTDRAGAARDTSSETASRVRRATESATRDWKATSGSLKRARRSSSESGRRVGYSTRGVSNCASRIIHRRLGLLPKTSQEAAEQAAEDVELALVQSSGKPSSKSASSVSQAPRGFGSTAGGTCKSPGGSANRVRDTTQGVCGVTSLGSLKTSEEGTNQFVVAQAQAELALVHLTAFREAREEENVGEIVEFALLNLAKGVVLVHGSSEEVDLVGLDVALLLLLAIRGGFHSRGGHGTAGEGGGYNAELHCC